MFNSNVPLLFLSMRWFTISWTSGGFYWSAVISEEQNDWSMLIFESYCHLSVYVWWFASFSDDFGSRQSAGIQDNRPLALWVTETVPCDADHISSEVRWISRRRSNTWEQALIQELSITSWAIWPHLYFRYCVKNINICHTLTGNFLQFDWQQRLIAWVTLRNKLNCFHLCQEGIWKMSHIDVNQVHAGGFMLCN